MRNCLFWIAAPLCFWAGAALGNDECNNMIVNSGATGTTLEGRGDDVAHCLGLVDQTVSLAYKLTYKYCRQMALAREVPETLTLPNGRVVAPVSRSETWEELALRLGGDAETSGCRDAILSALDQVLFANTENVRRIFDSTQASVPGALDGEWGVEMDTLFGAVAASAKVDSSAVTAEILRSSELYADGNGTIWTTGSPYRAHVQVSGVAQAAFLSQPFSQSGFVLGSISGRVTPRALEVVVDGVSIENMEGEDGSVLDPILQALLANAGGRVSELLRDELSRALTRELRASYGSVDPFSFLNELR